MRLHTTFVLRRARLYRGHPRFWAYCFALIPGIIELQYPTLVISFATEGNAPLIGAASLSRIEAVPPLVVCC
jgi:hypothetical protein